MSAKTIKSALGVLQDDPDQETAWQSLRTEVGSGADMSAEDLRKLLEAARRAHDARREYDAVARLLDIEAGAARGTPREVELVAELARTLDEDLLDDEGAHAAYERLLALRPGDTNAQEAIERGEAKRGKWHDLVERYVQEAHGSGDPGFRSSLLVSAAEVTYRFGGEKDRRRVEPLLREALDLDAKNRRGQLLLERLLRGEGRWEDLTKALAHFAGEATQKEEKVAALQRLTRVLRAKLQKPERAVEPYETILDFYPGHPEATSFLSDHFTSTEQWEHLVALYEGQLASGALRGKEEEFGAVLQIAMVHWRMRGRPDAAEPWFERLRKLEPANAGMLRFFRELCTGRGETTRLAAILTDAQRALSEGAERSAIGAEIAKLAEEGANAQKAIEQWRTLLRQDPRNADARAALKRLYRQTAGWNALTDLLRQELEKLPQDDVQGRLGVLREIGELYRDHLKSDSALVTVLSQIVQLDPEDLPSVRELARVYEALQRWRDLLTTQARQAELEAEPGVKAELWRAVARRWLEQFSNVQNAVDAYEKLRATLPGDREAVDRLKELYVKRRAYKPLFELLGAEAASMEAGPERRELWTEMAKLAAERLDMGAQAVALYKKVLDEDPSSAGALDALEKQAERDKDFATVADVLERRAAVASDDATRLSVLQKLGAVYSDRLHDHAKAMSAWRRVLGIQPGHAKALRVLRDSLLAVGDYDGLSELYAQTNDWEGLVEVLSGAADKATDPGLKIDLSFRCARIYVDNIGAPERAFRAYERVLSVRHDDARAASALVPLYEKDEKWGRLPALYEVLMAQTEDVDAKLALLDKLVRVTGHQLQDRAAAYAWARKAYDLAPGREGALEAFEAAARAATQWQGFVDALTSRLGTAEPPGKPRARPALAPARRRRRGSARTAAAGGARRCGRCAPSWRRSTPGRWAGSTRRSRPTAVWSRRTRATSSRSRRSIASCAKPTAATICDGSSICGSSAPTRRTSSSCSKSGPCSRRRPSARPIGPSPSTAACSRSSPSTAQPCEPSHAFCARRGMRRAPSTCSLSTAISGRAPSAPLARWRWRGCSSIRCASRSRPSRRASGHSSCWRTTQVPSRSSSSCCPCPRPGRARRGFSSSPTSRPVRSGVRPRCSRCSSPPRRRERTVSPSTAGSPTFTRPA